ncbi:prepilin-type N-terminal cleavage/methylation domain-containing protein [Amycolatopsis sp. NPDC051716]|jgi:prepilin-type N-terminal cleavage/methylation domain-containing protein|uniref:competence type IV pilus major pilin ComGC n=1 Tax=Amycolatopsis sp. NPDC051716 TaxID=3155804 RepID=UPI0034258AEF
MLEKLRAARANQDGFTLIELLIVVVILGVLAGVVVFAVQAFNGDGKAAACNADWKSVETANEALYAKTGSYAADPAALKTAGYLKDEPSTTNGYTITIAAGVVKAAGACTH